MLDCIRRIKRAVPGDTTANMVHFEEDLSKAIKKISDCDSGWTKKTICVNCFNSPSIYLSVRSMTSWMKEMIQDLSVEDRDLELQSNGRGFTDRYTSRFAFTFTSKRWRSLYLQLCEIYWLEADIWSFRFWVEYGLVSRSPGCSDKVMTALQLRRVHSGRPVVLFDTGARTYNCLQGSLGRKLEI